MRQLGQVLALGGAISAPEGQIAVCIQCFTAPAHLI